MRDGSLQVMMTPAQTQVKTAARITDSVVQKKTMVRAWQAMPQASVGAKTSAMQFWCAAVANWVLTIQTASAVGPMRVTPAVRGAMLTYQCSPWDALDSSSTICMAASWQLALFRSMAVPT